MVATVLALAKPDFAYDGRDWPLRAHSAFHQAGGMRFHVQRLGSGPTVLMLHGTGASTHSFRDLALPLSERLDVVMVDLPGHGFSGALPGGSAGLDAMSGALSALVRSLDLGPALVVGHSAGAAVALRIALDGGVAPRGIVSFNGALRPFAGSAGPLFSLVAKALFLNPFAPRVFALSANDRRRTERLIANTGSRLSHEGIALYQRLFRRSGHVAGALAMMASWDLKPLVRDLPRLGADLLLVVGENDAAVSPAISREVAQRVPRAEVATMTGLGHLAHEEDPAAAATLILSFAERLGIATVGHDARTFDATAGQPS